MGLGEKGGQAEYVCKLSKNSLDSDEMLQVAESVFNGERLKFFLAFNNKHFCLIDNFYLYYRFDLFIIMKKNLCYIFSPICSAQNFLNRSQRITR